MLNLWLARTALALTVFSLVLASPALARAAVIIGPDVRNGSFELAAISPWISRVPSPPLGSYAVVTDPGFAAHGQNYVRMTSGYDPRFNQRFEYDPAQGRTFRLEWDARAGGGPLAFDTVQIEVGHPVDRNIPVVYDLPDGWVQGGPLSSDAWRHYEFVWTFDPVMPAGEYEFGVGFLHSPPSTDPINVQYTGLLDNVTLTQIPEPAGVAAGLLALAALARCQRAR